MTCHVIDMTRHPQERKKKIERKPFGMLYTQDEESHQVALFGTTEQRPLRKPAGWLLRFITVIFFFFLSSIKDLVLYQFT